MPNSLDAGHAAGTKNGVLSESAGKGSPGLLLAQEAEKVP